MKHRSLVIIILIFAVFLIGAGIAYNYLSSRISAQQLATQPTQTEPEKTPEATGQATEPEKIPARDFAVTDLDGQEVHLLDYVGKPIVLSYWATWCGACQTQMPGFNNVYEQLDGEVTFLMVNAGESEDTVREYLSKKDYTFPVLLDTAGEAVKTYGISAFPTSFFIDAEGNLITYAVGALDEQKLMIGVDMIYTP